MTTTATRHQHIARTIAYCACEIDFAASEIAIPWLRLLTKALSRAVHFAADRLAKRHGLNLYRED